MNFKECKSSIRRFMQAHYSDERLAALLAHAREEMENSLTTLVAVSLES